MRTFEEEYGKLNDQQKQAVDTIEGPVMVVAGPGTGKTQVLSVRVANILKQGHVSPRNILCLTYTNSGATAMRERLRSLVGAAAYNVTINTIHGFCNDVITAYPQVFDSWSALDQISDVEQCREVNAIIDGLMPNLELINPKSPYVRTKGILSRISQVKREGKSVENLLRAADEYDIQMQEKSKEGTKAHEKNMASAQKFRDFIAIFERYQKMLQRTQRYDYDDMILYVLEALKEEDWMLAELQEQYQYILVDEFQDTNGAQFAVIDQLTTARTPEDLPNIFVVGDDDQAIYRFQGANLQNILSFTKRFPTAPIIVLTTSYRCTQPILDAAGTLIKHNTERLVGTIDGLTKDLTSVHGADGEQPTLVHVPSDATEPWLIADMIEDELAAGTKPQDIALLVQKNSELRPIYDILRARGIPVQMDGKINLLDQTLVKQAINILLSVQNLSHSPYLSVALSCSCFGCHPADLGRLFHIARTEQKTVQQVLLELDTPESSTALQSWHNKDAVITAYHTLLSLHQQIDNRMLLETLQHILTDTSLLPTSKDSDFSPLDFAALQSFFEYVRYRSYENTNFDLALLINDIGMYTDPNYGLRLSFSLPHLSEEGVQLLTAHQSKGLEYDVVILPNFRDGHWDKKKPPASVSIPEDILFGWEKDQKTYEQHQDERRVAYVALTRARKKVIFTCPTEITTGVKPRTTSPSGFFVEAGTLPEVTGELRDPSAISTLLHSPVLELDSSMKAYLQERLKNFRLSVTALNHFLEDPQIFVERDLLRKPEVKNESMAYGTAVHEALREWGIAMQQGEPISKEAFVQRFVQHLENQEILTDAQRANLTKLGTTDLGRYYDQRLDTITSNVYSIEKSISANVGDVPLKGIIDRIDRENPTSQAIHVIDYKTGKPKSENAIRDDGNYYRQLVFYKLLLQEGMPQYMPTQFTLDFIGEGTDHPIARSFVVSDQEVNELKALIQAVWTKIINLDFTPLHE